jgi:hypothetical protein
MILHPDDLNIKLISTMDEKAELMKNLGIDHLIITPFTRDFSNLNPQEYIKDILVEKIGTTHIIIGYDHRFGKDRSGGLVELQNYASEFGYEVEELKVSDRFIIAITTNRKIALLVDQVEDVIFPDSQDLFDSKDLAAGMELLTVLRDDNGIIMIDEDGRDTPAPLHDYGEGANKLFRILLQLTLCKGKRLMIDEIDAGIHHSRFAAFWKVIF